MSKQINISSSKTDLTARTGGGGGSAMLPPEWTQVLAAMHRHVNKAVLDMIEWDEERQAFLFSANILATGGIASFADLDSDILTLFDQLPIASDSVKGIAAFDPEFFQVLEGLVTFIGKTGGGGEEGGYLDEVTGSGNGNVTFKQTNRPDIVWNAAHTHNYLSSITKKMVEDVLTGVITTHSHNLTKAMVEGVLTGVITSHTHNYISSITKAMVETVLTGLITSHTHNYISSITKAMVEGVLTGVITTHSHNLTKAMVEGVLTGVITSHTHSQYLDATASRTKNTVLAAPADANGAPTFRALEASDMPVGTMKTTSVTILDPNTAAANATGIYVTGPPVIIENSTWPKGFTHPGILTVTTAAPTNIMQQAMDANGGVWTRRRTGTTTASGTAWKKMHHVGDTYDGNLLATGGVASQQTL